MITRHRFWSSVALAALVSALMLNGPSPVRAATQTDRKFSGTVVLTYPNPTTIILHIIKGKVNAATTFTMTPTTVYVRNGRTVTFTDIRIGDSGYIMAHEVLPSGELISSKVVVTGPP